jgi:general secretion pathway protein L
MAKRFIGIDIDSHFVRIAIAAEEKSETTLVSAEKKPYTTREEMLSALGEMIGEPRYSDRLAAAVPANESFVRWLKFPFTDVGKIKSALSFELSTQLPIAAENCITDFQKPLADEKGGCTVPAAAIRTEALRLFLEPFDNAAIPLQILDLAPFAFVSGLRSFFTEGILTCLSEQEMTITLVTGGRIVDYRLLPAAHEDQSAEELSRVILRESMALQIVSGQKELPLYLMGSRVTSALVNELQKKQQDVKMPTCYLDQKTADPEFLPAIALAMRAALSDKEKEFNFRRGQFALKSEWAALKKGLIAVALLLFFSGITFAGAAYLNFAHKAGRAEALKQEMVRIYKETFPGSQAIVDIPLQMKSGINELKKRGRLIGAGAQSSPLTALREISLNMPADIRIEVQDLSYNPEAIRLDGFTVSFDAANQMAKSLEKSPLFEKAQIADAKMSLEGDRVDFRINLVLSEKKE